MAQFPTPLVTGKFVEAVQTTQYVSPVGTRTIIDKCTVVNTSAANVAFSANLVAASGAASDANLVIDARAIAVGETYTCPEVVGHILEPNGFISALASAGSALALRISGRQVT
jgi:hypothetical protein